MAERAKASTSVDISVAALRTQWKSQSVSASIKTAGILLIWDSLQALWAGDNPEPRGGTAWVIQPHLTRSKGEGRWAFPLFTAHLWRSLCCHKVSRFPGQQRRIQEGRDWTFLPWTEQFSIFWCQLRAAQYQRHTGPDMRAFIFSSSSQKPMEPTRTEEMDCVLLNCLSLSVSGGNWDFAVTWNGARASSPTVTAHRHSCDDASWFLQLPPNSSFSISLQIFPRKHFKRRAPLINSFCSVYAGCNTSRLQSNMSQTGF